MNTLTRSNPITRTPRLQGLDLRRLARLSSLVLLAMLAAVGARAAELRVTWDAVQDSRVSAYEVHYGDASGQYQSAETTTQTNHTLAGLAAGQTYYVAVKAVNADRSLASDFSNEVSATIPVAAPMAAFTSSLTSGVAPLSVSFQDQSTGSIDSRQWAFGTGDTSTHSAPSYTFTQPGQYQVSLTITGPGGSATATALISVTTPPPSADFTVSATSGTAPLTLVFDDASQGEVDAWSWSFGDGGGSSAPSAAWTYTQPGTYAVSLSVSGPGGSDTLTRDQLITVTAPAPVADFDATNRIGEAPLSVVFQDRSSGDISSVLWSFGDGQTSTARAPTHVYKTPGNYDVSLTVEGPGGRHTTTKPAFVQVTDAGLPIEVGEIAVDQTWQWVAFGRVFTDPVVVTNPPSANDTAPVLVRIRDVRSEGFWIRLQEWDYQDGPHGVETLHYLAMERGVHALPNGSWIEAGTFDYTQAGKSFRGISFTQSLGATPVVLTTLSSDQDPKAATPRLRNITATGFEMRVDAQEAEKATHGTDTISYIAWPVSQGTSAGVSYRVGLTGTVVSHQPQTLTLGGDPSGDVAWLANLQTVREADPVALRYRDLSPEQVVIWAQEEQSRDKEISHLTEAVGWILFQSAE